MENCSVSDICCYVGDRKRCLKEGEAVLNAQHLFSCGIKKKTGSKVTAGGGKVQRHSRVWERRIRGFHITNDSTGIAD
jgi:hypothetical protein